MCIGKAFIVRKGHRWPDYLMDSNEHAPLVKKFNLDDSKLTDRTFVRLEAWPLGALDSLDEKDWEINRLSSLRIDDMSEIKLYIDYASIYP